MKGLIINEWGWMGLSLVIVIIILRMMSELNKEGHKIDSTSTQTFILKKRIKPKEFQTSAVSEDASRTSQPLLTCKRALVCFNSDGKYYTPAFIDPLERGVVVSADEKLKEIFNEKVQEAYPQKQIFMPKPSSHFCFVCHQSYLDYLKHISHPVHQKNIASNGAQELIDDLIEEFGRKQRRTPTVGFGGVSDVGRKRCKIDQGHCGRAKVEALFRDYSTCLPGQIQSQIKFLKN